MNGLFKFLFRLGFHYHLFPVATIIIFVTLVIGWQIGNRATFANTELYSGVMDRWGAPIAQQAPSVRYVATGTVFSRLEKLPFAAQVVSVSASMNYRKRGLFYFSGFDFRFQGKYTVTNTQPGQIDVVFAFPINLERNKVLLSDLAFEVDALPADIDLLESRDKLVWTGRLEPGQSSVFSIGYSGRGLDQFNYLADPGLPVKNFRFTALVRGGVAYDYTPGVVPAARITSDGEDEVTLDWEFASLESGVPVGLILPAEKAFDALISTLLRRSLIPFLLFFFGLNVLYILAGRRFHLFQAALLAACYAFFYVLLPYFAAYMNFYLAYGLSLLIILMMFFAYFTVSFCVRRGLLVTTGLLALLFLPTLAVILEGYTGLIYTLEILVGLGGLLWLSGSPRSRDAFARLRRGLMRGDKEAGDVQAI